MTEPDPRPARPRPARVAVSLAFGPVPFISVPVTQTRSASPGEIATPGAPVPRHRPDQLWARATPDGLVRVGVTGSAQQSLGDITGVALPSPGETVAVGEACGDIESSSGATDVIAPVTGTVRVLNEDLVTTPSLINTDPYGRGWMFEIEIEI
jgi:glycine cleavage system H protein